MTPKKLSMLTFRRCGCVLLALVMVFCFAACGGGDQEPLRAPSSNGDVAVISIETAYGTLSFPEELAGSMRHMEVTENNTAMQVFYMMTATGEKELFRIFYADTQSGTHLGYLTTDTGEIPMSYTICEYADEDFADAEERKLYYNMMDAFTVVINSIYADERFSETRVVAPVGDHEVSMKYWKVTLPDNVQYTETEENGNYRADFFGEVSGERIDLYMIGLGDLEADAMIGLFTVKGEQKPVMVKTFSLEDYSTWPEEEQTVIYQMMDSVNDVIQVIAEDKNFGAPVSAE